LKTLQGEGRPPERDLESAGRLRGEWVGDRKKVPEDWEVKKKHVWKPVNSSPKGWSTPGRGGGRQGLQESWTIEPKKGHQKTPSLAQFQREKEELGILDKKTSDQKTQNAGGDL